MRLLKTKLISGTQGLVFGLVLGVAVTALAVTGVNGYLDLNGSPTLMATGGSDLILGTDDVATPGELVLTTDGSADLTVTDNDILIANGTAISGANDLELYADTDDIYMSATDDIRMVTQGSGDKIQLAGGGTEVDLTVEDNQITVEDGTEVDLGSAVGTSTGVLCVKSDGNLGQCTGAVSGSGTCTCG